MRAILITTSLLMSCLLLAPARAADWGDLTVQFTYDGAAPAQTKIIPNKDAQFCGQFDIRDESLVVNKENKGVQNVVGFLYVSRSGKKPPVHPSYAEQANANVKLDNDKCRFEPRITILRTSQTLTIGNSDNVGHNSKVDVISPQNVAQNLLIPAGGEVSMNFGAAERLPASVSCNIHPWMSGRVVIREDPYAAATDKDGRLTIKNVPAGEWTFQFWHEKSGYVSAGKQNGKAVKWRRGRVDVKIKPGGTDLGEVKLAPALFK